MGEGDFEERLYNLISSDSMNRGKVTVPSASFASVSAMDFLFPCAEPVSLLLVDPSRPGFSVTSSSAMVMSGLGGLCGVPSRDLYK